MRNVSIITSSTYNPTVAKGAYGCVVLTIDKDFTFSDCFTNSTGNRLELMAVIRALEELEVVYPGENLNIEFVSKLNYLTLSFSPGKLRANLLGGETLPNYDLWKKIFVLGTKHKWKVTPVKTVALDRFHKAAASLAVNCAKDSYGSDDPGMDDSKKKRKSVSVFQDTAVEVQDEPENTDIKSPNNIDVPDEPTPTTESDSEVKPTNDMPTIESTDPPF